MTDTAGPSTIVAAVILDRRRVLLVRRRIAEGTLSWQFPSGEVEPGETPQQTAARESTEEVGLSIQPVTAIGERIHPATGRRIIYVAGTVVDGEARIVDDEELAKFSWCTASEVARKVPTGIFEPVQELLDAELLP